VFFNLFAATERSANVCIARGTLCNDPSVYITITAYNCGCEFGPTQFRSVLVESLATTRGTLRFRGTPVEKHWRIQPNWRIRFSWSSYVLDHYQRLTVFMRQVS